MRKIIPILITLTVLLSLFAITTAFAATRELGEVTWTQDFESLNANQIKNLGSTPAYKADGVVMTGASGGNVGLSTNGGIDGGQAGYFYRSATANNAACKVLIDQNAFELNKTYVLRATIKLVPQSPKTYKTHKYRIAVLNGTGATTSDTYGYSFTTANEWTTIETKPFVFTQAMKDTTGGINARIDDSSIGTDDVGADKSKVYIDNFQVVEVESYTEKTFAVENLKNTVDFEDVYGFVSSEYIIQSGVTLPYVVPVTYKEDGQTKTTRAMLFVPTSVSSSRLILPNVLNANNLGESYKVNMKIYIPGTDQTGSIKVGTKVSTNDNSYWNSDTNKYDFGPSGKKITLNQWSTIEFVVTAGYNNNDPTKNFVNALAFTYNSVSPNGVSSLAASSTYPAFYIDDITFTPINYFDDANGNDVVTEFDAGYYADTVDGEKEGVISVNSYISNQVNVIQRYDAFGLWVYRQDDPSKEETIKILKADGKDNLIASNGYINVLVEGISEEFFGTNIVVKPYVIMRGATFWGDEYTYCVNDAGELKWVGAKSLAEEGGEE